MKASVWIFVIMVSVVIASAVVFYVVVINDDSEEKSAQEQTLSQQDNGTFDINTVDFNKAPPKPVFNSQDNPNCRVAVTTHYEIALRAYNAEENEVKLMKDFEEILARQRKYDE